MPKALRWLARLPDAALIALMLLAMADMLAGVFLRYVMTKASVAFGLPRINFFWVEEVGEFSLVWLTFIGAAIGVPRGTHFSIHMLTERLSPSARRVVFMMEYLLIAGFGLVVAFYGWQVAEQNSQSFSPALNINLWWLYFSAVVGGVLLCVYSLAAAVGVRRDA